MDGVPTDTTSSGSSDATTAVASSPVQPYKSLYLSNSSTEEEQQTRYFPGFCTPRSHSDTEDNGTTGNKERGVYTNTFDDDSSDSSSDSESEGGVVPITRAWKTPRGSFSTGRRRPAARGGFFASVHDQIRDVEDTSDSEYSYTPGGTSTASGSGAFGARSKSGSYTNLYSGLSRGAVTKGTGTNTNASGLGGGGTQQRRLHLLQTQLLNHQQLQIQRNWLRGSASAGTTTPRVDSSAGAGGAGARRGRARKDVGAVLAEAASRAQLSVMMRDLGQLEM